MAGEHTKTRVWCPADVPSYCAFDKVGCGSWWRYIGIEITHKTLTRENSNAGANAAAPPWIVASSTNINDKLPSLCCVHLMQSPVRFIRHRRKPTSIASDKWISRIRTLFNHSDMIRGGASDFGQTKRRWNRHCSRWTDCSAVASK